MALNGFLHSITAILKNEERDTSLSRRDMLSGIGLFGALAVAGPTLLTPSAAEAVEVIDDGAPNEAAEITEAQYGGRRSRGRSGRRGRQRSSRRRSRAPRRHARPQFRHPPRQRYSYGNLFQRCRYDYGFRRRNPGLCHRVLHTRRPRAGACFHFGGFTICG